MRISDWSSDVCSSDLFERSGNLQLDLVADQRDAEAEAEVAAADRRFRLESDGFGVGHRRGAGTCEVDVERHRAGHAGAGEVAGNSTDERRVWEECCSTCISWWLASHVTKKNFI